MQDKPDRKTRTRATSAPHSEIKMKKGGRETSIKSNKNEVNRHREKHREELATEKLISPTVYGRKKTRRNNSNKAKQNKIAHVITVQIH